MTDTAVQKAERDRMVFDLRRRSADAIAHALFDEIRHLLPRDIQRDVSRELWEAVYRNGTMIISDREAERLGLEPKDREGWTLSDRLKYEQEKIAAMHEMANFVVKLRPDLNETSE